MTTLAGSSRVAASRVGLFTESVIREMTRLADEHGAINLAQGFPDFDAPEELKEAACRAISGGLNQYPVTWGAPRLRAAIAAHYAGRPGWRELDPDREIVVTCGSTEAMAATFLSLVDPGDEVILLEPFYENYGPDTFLAGGVPRMVPLAAPDWDLDLDRLRAAIGPRTRAIVITTPHNPTGHVFSRAELAGVAELAISRDLLVFTDEIYEHIIYDGREHCSIATLPGMAGRTVTISALSKTYSVTGWRVGWAIAAPALMASIRKVHDFLTVGAPAPLQEAGVTALGLPGSYYSGLAASYAARRELFLTSMGDLGLELRPPQGAYYALTGAGALRRGLGCDDDVELCRRLAVEARVAAVPGSSFFANPADGVDLIRFAFAKRAETITEAGRRMREFTARV
jgi:aspartate/methionine/tyrosine aminotransferase